MSHNNKLVVIGGDAAGMSAALKKLLKIIKKNIIKMITWPF